MVRFGLLGCGRIGQVHARSLARLPNAELVAASDFFPDAAQKLVAEWGGEVRDTDAILSASDLDAVIIGTPTSTHYDIIHAAAANGLAIFCEKPIDLSSDRVRQCIDAVNSAKTPFMTAFNRRFDPSFAALQSRVAQGAIGAVEMVVITSRDPGPPPVDYIKSSGGLFRDMMIHDLDMARFLLGEEPVTIHAVGSCLIDPEIGKAGDVDTAAVTLTTGSGKICQISNSRRATYGYDQRIEVHGAQGMLQAANQPEDFVTQAGSAGFTAAPTMNFFLERYEAAYFAEMAYFVESLNAGTAILPSANDGLKAQLLADAATQSMNEGRSLQLD
ncbi:inositol 2-dehydrogenase [Algirhabdus cladophorae]|uniref:inositol 2-dehydrogenase n=1 Tax=Algirhabdus cladophorae TaxID=3377108 RepID=UPI003B846A1B